MSQVVLSGITDITIAVFQKWLSNAYADYSPDGQKLLIRMVRNKNDLRSLKAALPPESPAEEPVLGQRNRGAVHFPYCLYTIGAFGHTQEYGVSKRRGTEGIVVGKDKDNNKATMESFVPINITLGILFRSDKLTDVMSMVHLLFQSSPRVNFVSYTESGFKVEYHALIDTDFTIPETDGSPGDPFTFETTVILRSYSSIVKEKGLIKRIRTDALTERRNHGLSFETNTETLETLFDFSWQDLFTQGNPQQKFNYDEVKNEIYTHF